MKRWHTCTLSESDIPKVNLGGCGFQACSSGLQICLEYDLMWSCCDVFPPAGACKAGYLCRVGASSPTPMDGVLGSVCPPGHYCPSGFWISIIIGLQQLVKAVTDVWNLPSSWGALFSSRMQSIARIKSNFRLRWSNLCCRRLLKFCPIVA